MEFQIEKEVVRVSYAMVLENFAHNVHCIINCGAGLREAKRRGLKRTSRCSGSLSRYQRPPHLQASLPVPGLGVEVLDFPCRVYQSARPSLASRNTACAVSL